MTANIPLTDVHIYKHSDLVGSCGTCVSYRSDKVATLTIFSLCITVYYSGCEVIYVQRCEMRVLIRVDIRDKLNAK
jgi:hypothetical protein